MSTATFSTNQVTIAATVAAAYKRAVENRDADCQGDVYTDDDEEYTFFTDDPQPTSADFSGGPNAPSKSIAQRLDELCDVCDWRARWIQRGMICIPHEIKDLLVTCDPEVIGCGGWDHAGYLHWVGFTWMSGTARRN